MSRVPEIRIQPANDRPVRHDANYVLYWMTAFRRGTYNFALQRAVEWARELKRPIVILEALRIGYRWASDRMHRFVIDGMADNAAHFERRNVLYYPYVEPSRDADKGLLEVLADHAAVIVTDEFPCFFLPKMVRAVAQRLPIRLELVDSNGLLPLRAADHAYPTAYAFRRILQKVLPTHLSELPVQDPLARFEPEQRAKLPPGFAKRWPRASKKLLDGDPGLLAELKIDHSVSVSPLAGGAKAGRFELKRFLDKKLVRYAESNYPDEHATSGLSPYLHFGHVSAHEVFHELVAREEWTVDQLGDRTSGQREGWWNLSPNAEAFLDQLVTWRELGFNMCAHRDDYDQYASLPDWAQTTLKKHAKDKREFTYTLEEFAAAETHDEVWNAAQRELLRTGRIHNYLRMLWGKKILEWTPDPETALEIMVELNNKYALDGRDPNSYSGIFWVLGRYDRSWGPERPIYGKIRYMSSENTVRKLRIGEYLKEFA